MTPADILKAYRRAAHAAGRQPSAWLRLLMVASHGQDGCRMLTLTASRDANDVHKTARKWQAAGLVTISTKPRPNRAGRPFIWITITPKGLATLGFDQ